MGTRVTLAVDSTEESGRLECATVVVRVARRKRVITFRIRFDIRAERILQVGSQAIRAAEECSKSEC